MASSSEGSMSQSLAVHASAPDLEKTRAQILQSSTRPPTTHQNSGLCRWQRSCSFSGLTVRSCAGAIPRKGDVPDGSRHNRSKPSGDHSEEDLRRARTRGRRLSGRQCPRRWLADESEDAGRQAGEGTPAESPRVRGEYTCVDCFRFLL